MYGITKAPPPFSNAVNGNLHTFPSPTEHAIQDIKNSNWFPHSSRLGAALISSDGISVSVIDVS